MADIPKVLKVKGIFARSGTVNGRTVRNVVDEEIKQRIDEYFSFCQQSSIRPGIESLCMALHISRTTLFNWNNGTGCSEMCQELIQSAKAFIGALLSKPC